MRFWIFILLFSIAIDIDAQSLDSLNIEVGTRTQGASNGFQPLWLKANRFGMSSDRQFDQITWIEASNKQELSEIRFLSKEYSPLIFDYGATVFNAEHYSRVVLQQAYAQLKHSKLLLRVGRHNDLWDELDPDLSSGSLGISGNALPIPKITAAIDDYLDIPFTSGVLQFKGLISHGWLGTNRFMESFLHEKTFYGRINLGNWKIDGGIQHFTEWGGRRPSENIYLDRSLKGFLNVLFVTEANDGSLPLEKEERGFRPNRAGDQRGLLELGVHYENENILFHAYNQTPFESGTGIDIKNIDRLLGAHLKFKNEYAILTDILLEFIYTKQMEDYGKESQSYYNNGAMKTGWEYERNIIGTPLMTNRENASNYFPITPFDWRGTKQIYGNHNIINNRLVGANIAARWVIGDNWTLRTKLTPVMNYGARNYEYLYNNGKGLFQLYSLVETSYQRQALTFKVGVAYDGGQIYNNFGGTLGVSYSLFRN